ncbi:MAG: HIT family protein [Oscillospiraceae bacterium]|nr:HIT family protein [Oscillospiraceae bacterium]
MDKTECMYCDNKEKRDSLMTYVADLKVSKLYLLREQTYHGRCVVAYNRHDVELADLSSEDASLFMEDVRQVGRAISKAVNPAKVNYGMYGDLLPHLHTHVVPKQRDGCTFGQPFVMAVDPPKHLAPGEYDALIQRIKSNLNG